MNGGRSTTDEAGRGAAERLIFFSDAVVAIALTLLAIELPVPEGSTPQALAKAVGRGGQQYLAFLISFLVIFLYWNGHHRQFRYLTDATPALVRWNGLWLFAIVLTPFATRVLTGGQGEDHGAFPWRFGVYAVLQVIAGLASLMSARTMQTQHLVAEGAPTELFHNSYVRIGSLVVVFALSIPLAFVLGEYTYIGWSLAPVVMRLWFFVAARRRPAPKSPAPSSPAPSSRASA
ncbi:TMEM175 family protein [Lapillicoccus sp.]|uniref:TMEM175 family protein n=1 Tax=Lapillicoccus sp. TaxID=1909287 RepID=UPI0025E2508B|nr:TMEM175 family protein [Lapillicoccus sp.]